MTHLIAGTDKDNIVREIGVDFVTNGVTTITTDHSYIHQGVGFEAYLKFTLAAGASKVISLTTPATPTYVHYRPTRIVTSADKVTMIAAEGATVTSGTTISANNHNRNSSITAKSVLKDAPTVSVAGTAFAQVFLGGGTGVGSTRSGAETKEENEYVLKPATTYTITVTNDSTESNIIQINAFWYEEKEA